MAVKTIIVTGASRGIGLAIARFLLKGGHHVVAVARSKAPLEELQAEYQEQVRVLIGDMANFSLAKDVADLTMRHFGQIDGLIVNHGILPPVTTVEESEAEAWRKTFDVNFFSAVALAQATIPALRKSRGRIVFTSSGSAVKGTSTWGAYGSSKAALNHLAQTLAAEVEEVTSISIAPGVVDTEMQRELRDVHSSSMREQDAARFHNLHKEGSLLKPEQPGNMMARLVLDAPKGLSGKYMRWDHDDLAAFRD